ncbi:MAG: O-antigen ligase family protein [Candidatus Buchananbacteria bacterium]|nr:O-antigen ligase family protein [Candidatus Buchananbacteria bacterium]
MSKLKKIVEWLFYFYLFVLPWQTRLIWRDSALNGDVFEYGRFSLYGSQILFGAIIFLALFLLIKTKPLKLSQLGFSRWLKKIKNPPFLVYWLAVIFIFFAGLSIFWAVDRQIAYYRFIILLQGGALMALVVSFNFDLKKIAYAFVGSGIVQGIFSVFQFVVQAVYANKWLGLANHFPNVGGSIILQTATERWLRVYGSLPHPNVLAGFLVVSFLFLVYLSLTFSANKEKYFLLVGYLTILPALFFSFCRSAWIALILCLLILLVWILKNKQTLFKKRFLNSLLISVLVVGFLFLNLSSLVFSRINIDDNLEFNSIDLRLLYTRQALALIEQNPWQGVGLGNYTLGVFYNLDRQLPGYYYQPVHNLYLLVFAELGIFGILIFAALIILLLYFGLKKINRLDWLICWLSLLAVLVISLFDHYFWSLEFGVMIFWLVIGMNIKFLKE